MKKYNYLLYSHLYEWYKIFHRSLPWREINNAYHIWLSEVILQQTRVAQGMDYYLRFITRWPRVEDLAAAEEAEVLREWQGLGYYSRARNLHKAAQMIVERGWAPFPTRFEDIRTLPGIGEYTAGAIASFAYNQPYTAMDGNVYRVIARLLDIDEPFDSTEGKKLFRAKCEELLDREHPCLFNSAIMEFGALYCTPNLGDNCITCTLQSLCAAYTHGTAELLPVRKPRPKIRDRWFTYHIYIKEQIANDQLGNIFTLIHRREEKDIWYHLYEFPCEEWHNEPTNNKHSQEPTINLVHVLSHQRLHARFIIHKVAELPDIPNTIVIPWDDLDNYALSRLTLRALDKLQNKE